MSSAELLMALHSEHVEECEYRRAKTLMAEILTDVDLDHIAMHWGRALGITIYTDPASALILWITEEIQICDDEKSEPSAKYLATQLLRRLREVAMYAANESKVPQSTYPELARSRTGVTVEGCIRSSA